MAPAKDLWDPSSLVNLRKKLLSWFRSVPASVAVVGTLVIARRCLVNNSLISFSFRFILIFVYFHSSRSYYGESFRYANANSAAYFPSSFPPIYHITPLPSSNCHTPLFTWGRAHLRGIIFLGLHQPSKVIRWKDEPAGVDESKYAVLVYIL